MANKVLFGLKNVHYALLDEDAVTWETPVAVDGAVNLSVNPDGGLQKFYADNIAYFTTSDNNGYSGDLEMADVPAAVMAALLNWEVDDDGALVEIADAQPAPFALLCEFSGDESARKVVFYKCVAARPAESQATKSESTTVATRTLSLSIMPIEIDSRLVVKKTIELSETNATAYNAWYTAVSEPNFAVS